MPSTKVLVVGSGVIGLSCAWRLCQAGFSVTICDPYPGSGASHVAAGMLAPVTEASYGEEHLAELCLQAAARWPAFAKELEGGTGLDIGYLDEGTLLVGTEAGDVEHLKDLHAFHHQLGLSFCSCVPSACREIEPTLSPTCPVGIFAPKTSHLKSRTHPAWCIVKPRLSFHGAEVILPAEIVFEQARPSPAWRGRCLHEPRRGPPRRGLPRAGALARTPSPRAPAPADQGPDPSPVPRRFSTLPPTSRCGRSSTAARSTSCRAWKDRRRGHDGRKGEDLRMTAGATREMLDDALLVLPSLGEAELLEASTGLRPATPDNVAIVGPSSVERLFYHGLDISATGSSSPR